MKTIYIYYLLIITILFTSCNEEKLPREINNTQWIDIEMYNSSFYKRCGEYNHTINVESNVLDVDLMEREKFVISRVEKANLGYKIYTKNPDKEELEENDWYYYFKWIDEKKGIAIWEYVKSDGTINEGFSYVCVKKDNLPDLNLQNPPCEICFSKNECDSINFEKKYNHFLDSIAKLKIDDYWYKEYNIWFEDYTTIKVLKDTSYISAIGINDVLVPLQKKDTLFLYNKVSKSIKYNKDKTIPELKIIKVEDQFFLQSDYIDLNGSISNKPSKFGLLIDEMKEN